MVLEPRCSAAGPDVDGKQDLVVAAGACSADEGGTSCAKAEAYDAWIFLDPVAGGAREMDEADIVLEGDYGTGNALATRHDITGDGLLDVVVGRFSHDYDPYINEALVFSPGGI